MATRYAVVELESTGSTQDEARSRFTGSGPLLVIARGQTAGRGRRGRIWVAPDRGMYASVAFAPAWDAGRWSVIPLVAGLAARSAVAGVAGFAPRLRWPNDLVTGDGAKIGGILAESGDGIVVVGCGINLSWEDPVAGAVSLDRMAPAAVDAGILARAWADALLDGVRREPEDWGREAYVEACATLGRAVSYERGAGVAVGIGTDGALLVDTGDAIVPIRSGEVRLHDVATLRGNRRN